MSETYITDGAIVRDFYKFIQEKLYRLGREYEVYKMGDVIHVHYKGIPYEVWLNERFEVIICDLTTSKFFPKKMEKIRAILSDFSKEKVFEVIVRKTSLHKFRCFVRAGDEEEAKQKALKDAKDHFNVPETTEYNVEKVDKLT